MKPIVFIVSMLFLYGCSAITHVTSNPSGVSVHLNDEYIGQTPVDILHIPIEEKDIFRAELEGYETQEKVFKEGAWDTPSIHFEMEARPAVSNLPIQKFSPTLSASNDQADTSQKVSLNSFSQRWAVIIGISEYENSGQNGLTNLIFADDDARVFARTLRNLGWSDSHMKVLINENATRRNIMIALQSWLTKAGPEDQVILFWAGHGYPDPEDPEKVYLATHDTDISIPVTGYRMDEVRRALEEIGSKNVILLADTCHAGKLITRGGRGISIVSQINNMQRDQKVPKGWVFMVGADTDRKAIEHSSWSNGAFTHSLIKGLNGEADGFQSAGAKDGVVTIGELKDFMKTTMPDETQRVLGVAKHPVITTSSGDPDIWNLTFQVIQ